MSGHKADVVLHISESLTFDWHTGIFALPYVASNFTLNTATLLLLLWSFNQNVS